MKSLKIFFNLIVSLSGAQSLACQNSTAADRVTYIGDSHTVGAFGQKPNKTLETVLGKSPVKRYGVIGAASQLFQGVGSAPEVISRTSNSLDLFARAPGGNLLHKRWISGHWGFWNDLGGIATSGPGATTFANKNRMMVFVRGTDGALWYRTWSPF